MQGEKGKGFLKSAWHFLWEDDSLLSWLANIIVAFVLIKFVVYPGLGFLLATTHPIVAVVSGSMHHSGNVDAFWDVQGNWYDEKGISKEQFNGYRFHNGFNRGDIMILVGSSRGTLEIGDVIVFSSSGRDPIIHRVVNIRKEDGSQIYWTKGDNNADSIRSILVDETNIKESQIIGKAVVRIPYLGYIKIGFVELINKIGGNNVLS